MPISSALGSSALLPAGLGFRNLIINGDFRINQRGFSSSTSGYNFDRWYNEASGGTQTITTQAFSTSDAPLGPSGNGTNYIQSVVASQSGVNDYAAIGQKIEGVRLAAGQQVSVSFWAKTTSGTPKVSVEFQQIFGTGGSSAVFTAAPTAFTLSTSWVRYQTTVQVPSISGKTIGANDCLILFLWLSSGSTYSARSNSIGVQNSTIQFWGVQVEANYQPTPFEHRPIGVELALCQRYYEKSYDLGTAPGANTNTGLYLINGSSDTNGNQYINILFAVPKRHNGYTMTFYLNGGTAGSWTYYRNGANGNVGMFAVYSGVHSTGAYNANMGAGWVSSYIYGQWTCSAEL
jgi:hypothetical protein